MGMQAAMWAAAAVSAKSAYDARKARKEDKAEAAKLKKEQDDLNSQKAKEEMAAKKQEFENSRSSLRRAQRRGRLSTILDSKSTLG